MCDVRIPELECSSQHTSSGSWPFALEPATDTLHFNSHQLYHHVSVHADQLCKTKRAPIQVAPSVLARIAGIVLGVSAHDMVKNKNRQRMSHTMPQTVRTQQQPTIEDHT
eukprot:SAG31_NODE_330_length_17593_cov_4.817891_30_plen_110_part_00